MSQDPAEQSSTVRMYLSAPALRNLVGNDPELELKLKTAAVREVLKQQTCLEQQITESIHKIFASAIGEVQRVYDSQSRSMKDAFKLTPFAESMIRDSALPLVKSTIEEVIKVKMEELSVSIEHLVENALNSRIDATVTSIIKAKVDKALRVATETL